LLERTDWSEARAQFSELLEKSELGAMRTLMDKLGLTRKLVAAASMRNVIAPLLAALLAPPPGNWPTTIADALAGERIRYRLNEGGFNPALESLGDEYTVVLFKPPSTHLWAELLNTYKLLAESKEEVKMRLLAKAKTSGGTLKFMANNTAAINGVSLTTDADGGLEPCRAPGTVTTREQLVNALPKTRCKELVKVLGEPAAAALVTICTPLIVAGVARGMPLPVVSVKGFSAATGAPIGVNPHFMGALTRWPARALGDDDTGASQVVELCEALRLQGLSAASTLEEMTLVLQRMAVLQMVGGDDEADPDERGDTPTRIAPRRASEFLCQSCFLVLPRHQLADEARMICRDCA
jgi:hypothetical protein